MKLKLFYSLKQCQPSSCNLSKCLCQIKSAYQGAEGGVTNKDIIDVSVTSFFILSSQDAFEDLPPNLGSLEHIRDCCSRQSVDSQTTDIILSGNLYPEGKMTNIHSTK